MPRLLELLDLHRDPCREKICIIRTPGYSLVQDACQIAKPAGKGIIGNDAQSHLVRYNDARSAESLERGYQIVYLGQDGLVLLRTGHDVAEPQGHAVKQDNLILARKLPEQFGNGKGLLIGVPGAAATLPVVLDPRDHLSVKGLGGREVRPFSGDVDRQLLGEG